MALVNLLGWGQHFDKHLRPKSKVAAGLVGVAANTNIAVAGIKVTDTILMVWDTVAGAHLDPLTFKVTSAGNIQCSAITTGKTLVVVYFVA